jgi:hypothetical protein
LYSKSRDVHSWTHGLKPETQQPPASPRIWTHIPGRYFSAMIDDIYV